jgi:hypothetical protein
MVLFYYRTMANVKNLNIPNLFLRSFLFFFVNLCRRSFCDACEVYLENRNTSSKKIVRFYLNSPLNYCNYLSINCLQIAMYFHQQTDYQHHSIYLKSYI